MLHDSDIPVLSKEQTMKNIRKHIEELESEELRPKHLGLKLYLVTPDFSVYNEDDIKLFETREAAERSISKLEEHKYNVTEVEVVG